MWHIIIAMFMLPFMCIIVYTGEGVSSRIIEVLVFSFKRE